MFRHLQVKAAVISIAAALAVVFALSSCGNGNAATPSSTVVGGTSLTVGAGPLQAGPLDGMSYVISAAKGQLTATSLTIPLHAGVVFANGEDDSTIRHEFAAADGSFDTGPLDAGVRYLVYFDEETTVQFVDKLDSSLKGSISVSTSVTGEQLAPGVEAATIPKSGPWVGIRAAGPNVMNVQVKSGQVINFYNAENQGGAAHHIVADDGSFDSGVLQPNQSFTQEFEKKGTFAYHDALGSGVKGTITVK